MEPKSLNSERILGYSLLATGLVIIVIATILVLRVLAGGSRAPDVFDVEAPTISLGQLGSGLALPEGIELPQSAPSGVKILPDEVFNKLLNMSVFYLAMMFLASTGAKVAGIGIQLIKVQKSSVP